VYDVKGQFESLCNKEMVDLDPLDQEDIQLLNDLITRHYAYTGSTVARFVLDDFENQLKNFIKVYPKDYKRVMNERKAKAESRI
jgi:Glutamate synthase domain 3